MTQSPRQALWRFPNLSLCIEWRSSSGCDTWLIEKCLIDYESEGCLQSEGGKKHEVEGSVVMVMLTRNPAGLRI